MAENVSNSVQKKKSLPMRKAYRDAFGSFINDVNALKHIQIHLGVGWDKDPEQDPEHRGFTKRSSKTVRTEEGTKKQEMILGEITSTGIKWMNADRQGVSVNNSFLIFEFSGNDIYNQKLGALVFTAPVFTDLDKINEKRTLVPEMDIDTHIDKSMGPVNIVRFITFEDNKGNRGVELNNEKMLKMQFQTAGMFNRMSLQPAFRAKDYSYIDSDNDNYKYGRVLRDSLVNDNGKMKRQYKDRVLLMREGEELAKSGADTKDIKKAINDLDKTMIDIVRDELGLNNLYSKLKNLDKELSISNDEKSLTNKECTARLKKRIPELFDDNDTVFGLCSLSLYKRIHGCCPNNIQDEISADTFDVLGSSVDRTSKQLRLREKWDYINNNIDKNIERCYPKDVLADFNNCMSDSGMQSLDFTNKFAYREYIVQSGSNKNVFSKDLFNNLPLNIQIGHTNNKFNDTFITENGKIIAFNSNEGRAIIDKCPALSCYKDKTFEMGKAGKKDKISAIRYFMNEAVKKADNGEPVYLTKAEFNAFTSKKLESIEGSKSISDKEIKSKYKDADLIMSRDKLKYAGADGKITLLAVDIQNIIGMYGYDPIRNKWKSSESENTQAKDICTIGWLSEITCKSGQDDVIKDTDCMMKNFEQQPYKQCADTVRKYWNGYETALNQNDKKNMILELSKLNDFVMMMDVYRFDTQKDIKKLGDDIDAAYGGEKTDNGFLYRPNSSGEIVILKELKRQNIDIAKEFKNISNKDNSFETKLCDMIENDDEECINRKSFLKTVYNKYAIPNYMLLGEKDTVSKDIYDKLNKAFKIRDGEEFENIRGKLKEVVSQENEQKIEVEEEYE